jgi:hypothetical protein
MEANDADRCELPDPLDLAMSAVLSREAGPEEIVLIEEALRHDPEFRRHYLKLMEMEAMLAAEFPAVQLPGWTPGGVVSRPRGRGRWLGLAAAAAAVLAVAAGWWFQREEAAPMLADGGEERPDLTLTLAKVTTLSSASARFEGLALTGGERLQGGLLELEEGHVALTFDSGAVLTLQGPAMFRLESEFRGSLLGGDMTARVPEQAKGFVVLTPTSFLRDLGTSFSVSVKDSKTTDLHVIEGRVEASPTGGGPRDAARWIRAGEAVRLSGGQIRDIDFANSRAPAAESASPRVAPAVHWDFESWSGNRCSSAPGGHLLELMRGSMAETPTLVQGPVGQAMLLDGRGHFGLSNYPGVGGSAPRTVAFWILLQPDVPSDSQTPNGIIAWGVNQAARKWQVAWNKGLTQGVVGAPRIEFGEGYVIGSTDLRDGRWHHVAVVYLGGAEADVSTHIRLYVDGRLEQISGRQQQVIATDTRSGIAEPLNIGRYLGRWPGREPFFFEGGLDEVQVFEEAILPAQIVELSQAGTLRQ